MTLVKAYPAEINLDRELLARCVDACSACAQACTACADACLSEEMIDELRKCIRTDLYAVVGAGVHLLQRRLRRHLRGHRAGAVISPSHRL